MLRLLTLVLFGLLLLAGCDSNEGLPADSSLFGVAVETPSGDPVAGLDLTMKYALVGTRDDDLVRLAFSLGPSYPNPFSTVAVLGFDLMEAAEVTLEVVDLEGQPAAQGEGLPPGVLVQGPRPEGSFQVVWQPEDDLPGGFYRARLIVAGDTANRLSVYTGPGIDTSEEGPRVTTALGQTDEEGRFATDDRARFPQFYAGIETEYRDENNAYLGDLRPSDEIVLVLRDSAGREQRYERTLTGERSAFDLTWDPE